MNIISKNIAIALIASAAALTLNTSAHANYLVNGSFEAGNLTGWTEAGNTGVVFTTTSDFGYGAQDGNYFAAFGPTGSDGILSQTFTDIAGETLLISGWLIGNGSSPSNFSMLFNNTPLIALSPVPSQGYTQYTFSALATGLDTFSVSFRNDPSFDAFDNFSVIGTSSVPTPPALLMFGAGLLSFLGMRKKGNFAA